jgi:hypothetical protein
MSLLVRDLVRKNDSEANASIEYTLEPGDMHTYIERKDGKLLNLILLGCDRQNLAVTHKIPVDEDVPEEIPRIIAGAEKAWLFLLSIRDEYYENPEKTDETDDSDKLEHDFPVGAMVHKFYKDPAGNLRLLLAKNLGDK